MKVFISQPMRDKTDEQIRAEREEAIKKIKALYKNCDVEIEILDTIFDDFHDIKLESQTSRSMYYLGKSIEYMRYADLVYFMKHWKEYRGCRIEHYVAEQYGLKMMEE